MKEVYRNDLPTNISILKELKYLTGLRFLAALYVFLFHMVIRGTMNFLPEKISAPLAQGALGVNIFFVLSGFLLTYSHIKDFSSNEKPSLQYYRNFLIKRFARIYPVYFVGLVFTLIGTFALTGTSRHLLLLFALNAIMLNAWVPHLSMEWFSGGSWSVSAELFFYLAFPVALPLLLRVKNSTSLFSLLCIFIALSSVPGMGYNFFPGKLTEYGFQLTYSFPLARLGEFIVGIITALLVLRFNWRIPVIAMIVLLGFLAFYLTKFGVCLQGYTAHNLVALPAIVSCVACLATTPRTPLLRWASASWAVYLGRISYSFYIMQLVILVILDILWKREIIPKEAVWVVPSVLILNLAVAIAMYELVEKRMHKQILIWFIPK